MSNHKIQFPQGKALMHLANTYPTLALCLMEMIQNAIDAEATKVHVFVDLQRRFAVVQDNGTGVSVEKFREALGSVMVSSKDQRNKLGQFGIGLVSPLGKAKSFTLTSKPRGGGQVNRWTFNSAEIEGMDTSVRIPYRTVPQLAAVEANWAPGITWRTVVRLSELRQDRATSVINLEDLHEQVQSKYGVAMRNARTTCTIVLIDTKGNQTSTRIQPREFAGTPIEPSMYTQEDVGEVHFRLYQARSRQGRRTGRVTVHAGDSSFGVGWRDFANQARGTGWAREFPAAFEALGSGFFEGVIKAKNLELHPERTKFVLSDALYGLYMAIGEWFEREGQGIFSNEAELARASRYQNLGLKSLERWDTLLDRDEYAALRAALEATFVFGRLGSGHVIPTVGTVGGPQDETSVRTGQGGAGKERKPSDRPAGGRGNTPDRERDPDRPGDIPLGVIGPRGRQRNLVRHDSIGLQLAHDKLDSVNLWELDRNLGILYLNTAHRLWERCENKDAHLLHLTDWIIMKVLHLLIRPREEFDALHEAVEQEAKTYVELFILSSPPKRR